MPAASPTDEAVRFRSISDLIPLDWSTELDEYTLDVRWSPDGAWLAALPSAGQPLVLETSTRTCHRLPEHPGGNGSMAWSPKASVLASIGFDSVLRLHHLTDPSTRECQLPRGWTERCAWNADGTLLGVLRDKTVLIVDAKSLEIREVIEGHTTTISDLIWHPILPDQLATAGDRGTRLWRLGETEPIGLIDDGVAAMMLTWSPDGRWLVSGDQTPSVHLLDISTSDPLYISGFECKVRCFAWETAGRADVPWLAAGGSPTLTLWPCFGKEGPRGAEPLQLPGHLQEVLCLDFANKGHCLASGGRDGLILMWLPHEEFKPVLIAREDSEITSLRWSPNAQHLAYGTSAGTLALHTVKDTSN